jgi:hypothetical protein
LNLWIYPRRITPANEQARVFVTPVAFRAGGERYRWLNITLAVLEGVLDTVGVGGVARGRATINVDDVQAMPGA